MDNKKFPKVLIFEHPPINKHGIGKTLYSFFYKWNKEQLGQIYSVDLPVDDELCQYFYVSETGGNAENTSEAREKREQYRSSKIYRLLSAFAHSEFGTIIRSVKFPSMINKCKELERWIEQFEPECIFYGIGENVRENQFVLDLAKNRGIPLVLYVSDDYMTKWLERPYIKNYSRMLFDTYVKSVEYASLLVVISEKMEMLYRSYFPNIEYLVASNSAICKRVLRKDIDSVSNEIHFSYTGNLGFGRWQMLSKFAEAIKQMNRKLQDTTLYLEIYSQETPESHVLNSITNEFSSYHTNVIGEELDRVRVNADVLLLVESFDEQYESILMTALSTKVPEYLSYGKLIMAWAPQYAWSLDYLKRNEAAYCITSKNLERDLERFVDLFPQSKFDNTIANGNLLFDERHEFFTNAHRFSKAIVDSVNCFYDKNT